MTLKKVPSALLLLCQARNINIKIGGNSVAKLGLSDKGRAIKVLVVCCVLPYIILRVFGQKKGHCCFP